MRTIPTLTRRAGLALAAGLLLAAGPAAAQWPDRPVTIIVPWGAGGGTDQVVRIFAAAFEKEIGKPVNVVNKTGGNGVVGHAAIQTAAPDGYTIGAATSEIGYFKTLGLAEITPDSFDLVSRIATLPAGVTIKANAPWKTMADLLADIKAKPKGTFTSSGSGIGGPWHMAIAGLTKAAGLPTDQVRFVPSRGGAPALQDVVSGGITMFTGSPAEAKALSDAGEVRVIAVLDEKRVSSYPDVPTLKEATGLDFTLINWFSLVLPKGVPADVRAKIVAAAAKAHAMPETRAQLAQRGFTPLWDGPDNFRTFAAGFSQTAGALLKDLGLAK